MQTPPSTELGQRLKYLRGERSQEDFARKLGLTRSALANYETGRTKPKLSVLREISRKLGLSEDFLLSGQVRNEYELNLVATGKGKLNECHETEDELAIVRILRAARPAAVKAIAGILLSEIEDDPRTRERLRGVGVDEDIRRLGAIFRASGQFEKGSSPEEVDAFLRDLARKARSE